MATAWVIGQLLLGIVLLAWAADRFLHASVSLAHHWRISPLVVGVILVGFGTSFPEFVVSFIAAAKGNAPVAIGNVFGSNIANWLLVFGLSACLFPMIIKKSVWRNDFLWLLGVSVLLAVPVYLGYLTPWIGVVLILLLVVVIFATLRRSRQQAVEVESCVAQQPMRQSWAIVWWLIGLGLIVLASELLINSAVTIAHWLGVSDLVIGLTVVTLGTSLPELAATLVSAWRGQYDVAVGHLVGSNIFNSTAVLAMPALLSPGALPQAVLHRDYPWMLAVTVVVWGAMMLLRRRQFFSRWIAGLFVLLYVVYIVVLSDILPNI